MKLSKVFSILRIVQSILPSGNPVHRSAALVDRHVDGVIAVAHEPQPKSFFRGHVPHVLPRPRLGVGDYWRPVGCHTAEFTRGTIGIVG